MSNKKPIGFAALLLSYALFLSSPALAVDQSSQPTEVLQQSLSKSASLYQIRDQLSEPTALKPMGCYVGELQELWQFPSDHLPIGMTFEGLHFASWNVLDSHYMSWVTEKNSQGISRSLLADEHVYIDGSNLTIRDQHNVDFILQMLTHPTHPRCFLALQECNKPFIEHLRSSLPAYFEVISHFGEAAVFDTRQFELIKSNAISNLFSKTPSRTVQDIILRRIDTGTLLRIVNAHLPGDPNHPARYEFGYYLADTFDPATVTIALGDMNFNELEIKQAVDQAFLQNSPFSIYSPYCTNVSPFVFISKAIDHFIIYSPDHSPAFVSEPEQLLQELRPIVELLNPECK